MEVVTPPDHEKVPNRCFNLEPVHCDLPTEWSDDDFFDAPAPADDVFDAPKAVVPAPHDYYSSDDEFDYKGPVPQLPPANPARAASDPDVLPPSHDASDAVYVEDMEDDDADMVSAQACYCQASPGNLPRNTPPAVCQ
jgi:hypothetical protein